MRTLIGMVIGWLVFSSSLNAQVLIPSAWGRVQTLGKDQVVRVRGTERTTIGTVVAVDAAGVTVRSQSGDVIRFPRDAVQRVERHIGPRPNSRVARAFKGAGWGLLAGYLLTLGPRMSSLDDRPLPWVFAGATTAGAAIGAARGGGAEHWVTMYRK